LADFIQREGQAPLAHLLAPALGPVHVGLIAFVSNARAGLAFNHAQWFEVCLQRGRSLQNSKNAILFSSTQHCRNWTWKSARTDLYCTVLEKMSRENIVL